MGCKKASLSVGEEAVCRLGGVATLQICLLLYCAGVSRGGSFECFEMGEGFCLHFNDDNIGSLGVGFGLGFY